MFNTLTCMGRLTRDVEMHHTPDGMPIASLSIAMSEKYKDEEKTTFLDVTIFGKTAETVQQYFGKGDPILLNGKLSQDNWEKDGQKRSKLKMIANTFSFIPRTQDRTEGAAQAPSGGPADFGEEDNLPF